MDDQNISKFINRKNENIVMGGLEYVMDGWLECECNQRAAERKYGKKIHYDQPTIDNYDVILSSI